MNESYQQLTSATPTKEASTSNTPPLVYLQTTAFCQPEVRLHHQQYVLVNAQPLPSKAHYLIALAVAGSLILVFGCVLALILY
ncbi:MAG: hypothetical protein GY799_12495 [Desulfobulbaceae bacterium]|nr:hypothetical protein [Desulfobulbaceae bacterium]